MAKTISEILIDVHASWGEPPRTPLKERIREKIREEMRLFPPVAPMVINAVVLMIAAEYAWIIIENHLAAFAYFIAFVNSLILLDVLNNNTELTNVQKLIMKRLNSKTVQGGKPLIEINYDEDKS